tara:strand:+ start:131 stop:520 length:390 start_codon:yes stop_codon:yes gene_type:complete
MINDNEAYVLCDNIIPNIEIVLTLKFKIDYPFKPPDVYLNNINIIEYFRSSRLFYDDLQKITERKCLCCHNLLCKFQWGPTLSTIDIINEIYCIFRTKIRLVERYLCKKITDKYLKGVSDHVRIYEIYL